jgi:hypothetical protein
MALFRAQRTRSPYTAANIALDLVLGHSPTVANYASCKPNIET